MEYPMHKNLRHYSIKPILYYCVEIKLFFGPLLEFIDNSYRPEFFHVLQAVLNNTGKIPHNLNVSLHYFPDIGPLYLNGISFPGFQNSPVNLAYRSRSHGCFFKACKNIPYFFAEIFFKDILDLLEWKRRHIVLQLLKLFCILFRHQVRPHAQQLAKFNERRAEPFQSFSQPDFRLQVFRAFQLLFDYLAEWYVGLKPCFVNQKIKYLFKQYYKYLIESPYISHLFYYLEHTAMQFL